MGKKEKKKDIEGRKNILGQLVIRWRNKEGKINQTVMDKGDIDRLFREEIQRRQGWRGRGPEDKDKDSRI